jgi:hypothetical protein
MGRSIIKRCEYRRCCNFFSITNKRQQFKRFCSRRCKSNNSDLTSVQRRLTKRKNAKIRWHSSPEVRAKSYRYKYLRYHALTNEQKRSLNKAKNDKYKDYRLAKHYERMANDVEYRLRQSISGRIRTALKNNYGEKSKSCLKYIGCSIPKLREHLESQFTQGMAWDNHGEWHIDHIKPCAAFDLSNEDEQRECFHYLNLQPLWAKDNIRKGAKWDEV